VRLVKFIQRKNALGDVLWIEPVVRRLARDYFRVVVVTPYAELFDNYPLKNVLFVKKLHPLLKVLRETSRAILGSAGFLDLGMAYEKSPTMHILRAYLDHAGYPSEPLSYPRIHLSENELARSEPSRTVVLHLSAPSAHKNFRTVAGVDWVAVKQYLAEKGYEVIGITDSAVQSGFYHAQRNPSLRELIMLIHRCAFFIGLDSGPSHIAAALGKPAIIFFGSVNPACRHIIEEFNGVIMQKPCEYAGCFHSVKEMSQRKCRLVEAPQPAPCCIFTTQEIVTAIERIIVK
jgi:ADP-heptose:LPS heptosyltransferase